MPANGWHSSTCPKYNNARPSVSFFIAVVTFVVFVSPLDTNAESRALGKVIQPILRPRLPATLSTVTCLQNHASILPVGFHSRSGRNDRGWCRGDQEPQRRRQSVRAQERLGIAHQERRQGIRVVDRQGLLLHHYPKGVISMGSFPSLSLLIGSWHSPSISRSSNRKLGRSSESSLSRYSSPVKQRRRC